MPVIDNIEYNTILENSVELLGLDMPNFLIGDRVSFHRNIKKILKKEIPYIGWDKIYEEYMHSESLRVVSKFKFSKHDPWWSRVEDEKGNVLFILDMCLVKPIVSAKEMYSSKKIKKTI